jgi:hypothetical protein
VAWEDLVVITKYNIDVSMLSSHLAQPRVGHLQQVLHIFSYLKCHSQSNLVFDPNHDVWDDDQFQNISPKYIRNKIWQIY